MMVANSCRSIIYGVLPWYGICTCRYRTYSMVQNSNLPSVCTLSASLSHSIQFDANRWNDWRCNDEQCIITICVIPYCSYPRSPA